MLVRKKDDDHDVAKATGISVEQFKVLLVVAGVATEQSRGGSTYCSPQHGKVEALKDGHDVVGGVRTNKQFKRWLIGRGSALPQKPPTSPSRGCCKSIELDNVTLAQLSSIVRTYNDRKDRAAAKAREEAKGAKEEAARAAAEAEALSKRKEAAAKQARRYPVLCRIIADGNETADGPIDLTANATTTVVRSVKKEIALLHQDNIHNAMYEAEEDIKVSLLPVPVCRNRRDFGSKDRSDGMIESLISFMTKSGMNEMEAIEYLQNRLDIKKSLMLPPQVSRWIVDAIAPLYFMFVQEATHINTVLMILSSNSSSNSPTHNIILQHIR